VQDVLAELGLLGDPVQIDDEGLLWLAPACEDWGPVVARHGLSAVIDLECGLDSGIPANPDKVIYVYFPFADEGVPTLHKLQAVARLGADLVRERERVLVHCQMGLNRSALVAGLVLVHNGMSGSEAVTRLQERRPGALYNEVFAAFLAKQPAGGGR
jgi:hypothetical protein